MDRILHSTDSLEETERLGQALAELLPPATTIGLTGTLGAGKTRLVQAVAVACGIPREEVVSPTFVLCHEYHGQRDIYHFDAYRLRDEDEFLQLGPEEYFDSPALSFVEWADRVPACLPMERIEIEIVVTGTYSRSFEIRAFGKRYEKVLEQLQARLSATGKNTPE